MAREKKQERLIVSEVLDMLHTYQSQASKRLERYELNKKWFETDRDHYEQHLYPTGRKDWQPLALANIIEANVRTVVAVLTDAKPIMRVIGMPYARLDDQKIQEMMVMSENLDNVLGHIWRVNDMHSKLRRVVLDGCLTGTMALRTYWDKQKYNGIGEVGVEPIHPKYIYFDETATELNIADGSCDWFIYAIPKPITWFNYYWPEKEVKEIENKEERSPTKMGLYIEAFKADYEIEEDKVEKEGVSGKGRRLKYPNGRKIIVGTDTVLLDEPLDFFPFSVEPIASKTGTFFGEDDVYRQVYLQDELDKKMNQLSVHMALSAMQQTAGDNECGVDQDTFVEHADHPGYHYPLEGGGNWENFQQHFFTIERANDFEPELMNYPFLILEFMEKVTGVTKLIQGMSAKRERQTGFEIGKMLETATIRLRERAGHVESLLRQFGLTCLNFVKQYYTEPRDVWHIEENTNKMVANTFPGWPTEKIGDEAIPIDYEFDVIVQPDTTLPIDLNSQADLAMRLKERGVITNAEVLKMTRYPHPEAALPDQIQGPEGQAAPPPPPTGAPQV